jgi:RNA polymerase sigma factor (TIGR02999 family)
MSEVTRILKAFQAGDKESADRLLALVYDELRRLAAAKLAQEKPGQTLDATGLVHEAYLRLVDVNQLQTWENKGHFFAAAAEAMRRILIENARRKGRQKHGGDWNRVRLDSELCLTNSPDDDLLALDEALAHLDAADELAGKLVKLRYFAGLTMPQAAESLGISLRTAERNWTYARTWLFRELSKDRGSRPTTGQ